MNIAEARAYHDGIEFYVKEKQCVISARRNRDGTIAIDKKDRPRASKTCIKNQPILVAICVIFSMAVSYANAISNEKMVNLLILAFIWGVIFSYYKVTSKDPGNASAARYHAAEHKVLNYWDKYGKTTTDCEAIMKMSPISFRCGSTVIAVLLILGTLVVLGITLLPLLLLKVLWCIDSCILTLYLWANGKCDFLQKCIIETPSYAEIEVAVLGMQEYIKMKQE